MEDFKLDVLALGIAPKRYRCCLVDADSLLYKVAKPTEEVYIIAKNIHTGEELEFPNITTFWGNKRVGPQAYALGWIGDQNKKLSEEEQISKDDFEVIRCSRLPAFIPAVMKPGLIEVEGEDGEMEERDGMVVYREAIGYETEEDAIASALFAFDCKVGKIREHMDSDDYRLFIGGKGNYRIEIAQMLEYKGGRDPKPPLFDRIRDAILEKYGNKMVICDGEEAEDTVSRYMWEAYLEKRENPEAEWRYCFSSIDKDTFMIYGPHFNYDKLEEGFNYRTPLECAKLFCGQMITGDKSVDRIVGLEDASKEFKLKHGLPKGKGMGKAKAEILMDNATNVKEAFAVVVEAYKSQYGEEKKPYTTWRGDVIQRNWLDYLRENSILLHMRRTEDEIYEITKTLDGLGIEY